MGFFNVKNKKKYTVIVGCGRLGASLASALSNAGEDVMIIDRDEKSFKKLPPSFGGIAVRGDAVEMIMEGGCDIKNATSLISVTNQDNTNIMIAQIARELFNVENVIARLYDPERKCVYEELGINTISPVILSTNQIFHLLHEDEMAEEMAVM